MTDDGTYLLLVDGASGYWYNMVNPGSLTVINDGNFTATPRTCTWQDTYFIVNSSGSRQFQLSQNATVSTWPAVNINFTGAGPSATQAIVADHSVLNIFCSETSEFWQDAGTPDFPYAVIPGSAQEFGLASADALCKYDNSLAGLFKNKMGQVEIARLSGFRLNKLSTPELDNIINGYAGLGNTECIGYMLSGHPMLLCTFETAGKSWEYDGLSKAWGERQATDGGRYWGYKFIVFNGKQYLSDYRNGNIYKIDNTVYTDNGSLCPMEVWSKHIWQDDKRLAISDIQIDVESGVGLTAGQGSNPQMMLDVSKDGGQTFQSVGWSSVGAIGEYRQRVRWIGLGAARDWVLKLRITDPVRRIITGASANIIGGFA
jgi:hypothetical protein